MASKRKQSSSGVVMAPDTNAKKKAKLSAVDEETLMSIDDETKYHKPVATATRDDDEDNMEDADYEAQPDSSTDEEEEEKDEPRTTKSVPVHGSDEEEEDEDDLASLTTQNAAPISVAKTKPKHASSDDDPEDTTKAKAPTTNKEKKKKKKTQKAVDDSASKKDKFGEMQKRRKKRDVVDAKRKTGLSDMNSDLKRTASVVPIQSPIDVRLSHQFSKDFTISVEDENGEVTKKALAFTATTKPVPHFMSFPKLPVKVSEATDEEKALFAKVTERFLAELRPEHLCTLQAANGRTGHICAQKDVLFDRMGNMREWTQAYSKALVENHPEIVKRAKACNNRSDATLKQTTSLPSKVPIDWHAHIIPSAYYEKITRKPSGALSKTLGTANKNKKAKKLSVTTSASTAAKIEHLKPNDKENVDPRPNTHAKQKPYSGNELKPIGADETKQTRGVERMVCTIRTATGQLIKNVKHSPSVCAAVRDIYNRTVFQIMKGNEADILTDVESQWLLFGYLAFTPGAMHTYESMLVPSAVSTTTTTTDTEQQPKKPRVTFGGKQPAAPRPVTTAGGKGVYAAITPHHRPTTTTAQTTRGSSHPSSSDDDSDSSSEE